VAALLLLAGTLASGVRAADGVLQINQVCAAGSGCFAGDTPGFPVSIIAGGSYRLTSNLTAPNANTTVVSITGSGVSLDLNGFVIRGTSSYAGPPIATCTNPGSGEGVTGTGGDVVVRNGHVIGTGSTGVNLGGPNSRVEQVTVEDCCGHGIAIGIGSLARESVATRNFLNGFIAGAASRVSACLAFDNGGSGVASFPGATRLVVEGCSSSENGVDGIFAGDRSLVRGSLCNANRDDGIDLGANGQVLESIAIANSDRGITVLGSPGNLNATAVGLNVTSLNGSGVHLSGGVLVGCTVINAVNKCPP
jgi:hypothetical protein